MSLNKSTRQARKHCKKTPRSLCKIIRSKLKPKNALWIFFICSKRDTQLQIWSIDGNSWWWCSTTSETIFGGMHYASDFCRKKHIVPGRFAPHPLPLPPKLKKKKKKTNYVVSQDRMYLWANFSGDDTGKEPKDPALAAVEAWRQEGGPEWQARPGTGMLYRISEGSVMDQWWISDGTGGTSTLEATVRNSLKQPQTADVLDIWRVTKVYGEWCRFWLKFLSSRFADLEFSKHN